MLTAKAVASMLGISTRAVYEIPARGTKSLPGRFMWNRCVGSFGTIAYTCA